MVSSAKLVIRVDRRKFLSGAVALGGAVMLGRTGRAPMWNFDADSWVGDARAWTAHIRTMHWNGEPAGMIHNLLVHHAAEIDAAVGEAPSSGVRAGLLRAEAEALTLAADTALFDLGQFGKAERHLNAAMRCAQHSDDTRLCSAVFSKRSMLAVYAHNYDDAVLAADAGMEYTRGNPLAMTKNFVNRAEAHAVNGDIVKALRDVDAAREASADATADDALPWLNYFDIDGTEGAVWLHLDRPKDAIPPLRRSLDAIGEKRSLAVVSCADLATALGGVGAPDQAVHVLLPVLPVAASTHSVERRARVQAAWRAVEPYNTPATRALRDQLRLYHLAA